MEQNSTPGPVDARVIHTPHGFRVLPAAVFKHSGHEFTLLNNSGSTIRVTFPVLKTEPAKAEVTDRSVAVFRILQNAPGMYDYLVELTLTDRVREFTLRASGGSDPHIIIDF